MSLDNLENVLSKKILSRGTNMLHAVDLMTISIICKCFVDLF